MIKFTNLSAHKPTAFISLTGNDDALPVIEDDVSFVPDIQLMMFGLGDCPHPNVDTAELIESIVLDQVFTLLQRAHDVAEVKGRTNITPEDILFLMKRNMGALKRLIFYLGVKDEAQIHTNLIRQMPAEGAIPADADADSLPAQESEAEESMKFMHSGKLHTLDWKKGRRKYCLAYLKKINIDESDLNQLVDIVKETRLERVNTITQQLNVLDYESFHAARCKSFCNNKLSAKRFLKWLKKGNWKDDISEPVLEILVYFAKETIACLIDMVMTLREESILASKRGTMPSLAITTDEVREVVRRCFFHHATSLSVFSRSVRPIHRHRLIAF